MNYSKLDYFITIAETGNLTKAAEILYVSQPSLSQYLKRLENSLGAELFDRNSSPLRLTYAGEKYYAYAIDARRRDENIRQELQDIQEEISGKIRLGVPLWRGSTLLPDVFPAFHEKYPGIRLELYEGNSHYLQNALMNNTIDLAVMNIPPSINYDKLFCQVFMKEKIMLAAPLSHPFVQEALRSSGSDGQYPEISLDILRHIPLILTRQGQNLTHFTRRIIEMNSVNADILLETANVTTAINLVAKQMACTFIPEEGARVCVRPGLVAFFTISDSVEDCSWELGVLYRKESYLNKIARLFIDELYRAGSVECTDNTD